MYVDVEKFGTLVAELNDPEACYDFSDVIVLRRPDGRFVWARDAGCSCPCPFEDLSEADLRPVSLADYEWDPFVRFLDTEWCYDMGSTRRSAANAFASEVRALLDAS